jgi:GTP-binding protein EngB required for normal cell division
MSDLEAHSSSLVQWFKNLVRPIFQKTEPAPVIEELDKLAKQVEETTYRNVKLFPICLLGQAGVGKSTLINTLVSDTEIVVPSGGGTGPLTANALRVTYGEKPAFSVRYHSAKEIGQTRFILEAELARRTKGGQRIELEGSGELEMPSIALDDEVQQKSRTEEAIGRACLLVAGAQNASRELPYLADALRWLLNQPLKSQTDLYEEDLQRLVCVQEALKYAETDSQRNFDSLNNPEFRRRLRDHACGFMAPLIQEMFIHWPSPLLKDSLELVDLPGIGILSDSYEGLTTEYLRNRAKAVMLVADSRGIRREDAELLRNSGFLNRLLHASSDPSADPVALIVAVVKIDDVAVENWKNDKSANEVALKTKAQHFQDVVENCRKDIARRLEFYLNEVWRDESGVISEGKIEVLQRILKGLQIFPVSAPQYRLHLSKDEEDTKPFLPNVDSTNILALRDAIAAVARECLVEQTRRREETQQRFFGQVRARLEVLSAQRNAERQAEEEIISFKESLNTFLAPLQREFDTRRGGFRNFLRKTIPVQIETRVDSASQKSRKDIQAYLGKLRDVHWKTLQAAVRKEGTFHGSRHINLPHDFALRFEEPVAEVWSRQILVDLRRETREFADYQSAAVNEVLNWARAQGIKVSTRLLEALVEAVKQHRQQVNAVGKEAVDDLRDKVRSELIKKIENPIRKKCQKFVSEEKDFGTGVKARILELFAQLSEEVVLAASTPAVTLLVDRFKEVDKEILAAFGEHSDPLKEAGEALVHQKEKPQGTIDAEAEKLTVEIEMAIGGMPLNKADKALAA